jgi:hypothetical protein
MCIEGFLGCSANIPEDLQMVCMVGSIIVHRGSSSFNTCSLNNSIKFEEDSIFWKAKTLSNILTDPPSFSFTKKMFFEKKLLWLNSSSLH